MTADLSWQPSLLDAGPAPDVDESFSGLVRVALDDRSWVERVPGWVSGSDSLFAQLLEGTDWGQRARHMYDQRVLEPRLTWSWQAGSDQVLDPPVLERMRQSLSAHYGVEFTSVGLNLYRNGRDSVAWHGDRIAKEIAEPLVGIVSVGEPRRFLLRPAGGGSSRSLLLGRGELLVTGGATQRRWQHSVPKVARAGPRISITFRHGPGPPAVEANPGPPAVEANPGPPAVEANPGPPAVEAKH
jgi:alkylated DNA repair dioxygenase AlkB